MFNFTDKKICYEFYEKLNNSKIQKYDFLIDECMMSVTEIITTLEWDI
jgi:hypothetical protein